MAHFGRFTAHELFFIHTIGLFILLQGTFPESLNEGEDRCLVYF